jgi:hypothetical protein
MVAIAVVALVVAAQVVVTRVMAGRSLVRPPIRTEIDLGQRAMARTNVGVVGRLATGPGSVTASPGLRSMPMWPKMMSPL